MTVALQAVGMADLAGFSLLALSYLLQLLGYRLAAPALRQWHSLPEGFRVARSQPRGPLLWLAGLMRLQAAGIFLVIPGTLVLLYALEPASTEKWLASGLVIALTISAYALDRVAMTAIRGWKRNRLKLA